MESELIAQLNYGLIPFFEFSSSPHAGRVVVGFGVYRPGYNIK